PLVKNLVATRGGSSNSPLQGSQNCRAKTRIPPFHSAHHGIGQRSHVRAKETTVHASSVSDLQGKAHQMRWRATRVRVLPYKTSHLRLSRGTQSQARHHTGPG